MVFLIFLNLWLSGLVLFVTERLRRRGLKTVQQIRREGQRSAQEAVGLAEEIYKVLSKEIQELRQEIDNLGIPAVIHHAASQSDQRAQARKLAAHGASLDEITDKVDIPKGEAELILHLQRMKSLKGDKIQAMSRVM
ncbi:MAG: DUF2802 domain-containing protein [Acidobacteria bacterium]|nr:DUF2802 domain-containing protein [Acidobacteriota bacterium]